MTTSIACAAPPRAGLLDKAATGEPPVLWSRGKQTTIKPVYANVANQRANLSSEEELLDVCIYGISNLVSETSENTVYRKSNRLFKVERVLIQFTISNVELKLSDTKLPTDLDR